MMGPVEPVLELVGLNLGWSYEFMADVEDNSFIM